MQNVRKVSSHTSETRRARGSMISAPEIIDIDCLASMSDGDLLNRYQTLHQERTQVINADNYPRAWEEEMAYVKREMQIRRTRRDEHDLYLRSLDREHSESERDLPEADLDNSSFVELN